MNILFASDGSILDSCIPDTAVVAVSAQSAATLVTPGVYMLQGISKSNGWPETFAGKCMLSIAGTTQSICTSHTLFANSTIWYRADASEDWKRADGGYSADDPVIAKLQADVKSNTEMVQRIEEYVGTLLSSSGKLKESVLPDILVHNKGVVKTEADLPKKAESGDYATVLETNTVWLFSDGVWANSDNTSIVTSVNGQTGDMFIDIDSVSSLYGTLSVGGDSSTNGEAINANLSGVFSYTSDNVAGFEPASGTTAAQAYFDSSRTVPIADEFRPMNVAVRHLIWAL